MASNRQRHHGEGGVLGRGRFPEGVRSLLPNRTGRQPLPREVLRTGDLIPDNRLRSDATDLLDHEAIAKSVAEITLTAQTPVNIALFGAWGSGKSSIYAMIAKHLASLTSNKVAVVRYDAWKYGGRELKRNFVDSIAKDLGLGDDAELGEGLHRPLRKVELNFGKWLKDNAWQLLIGLVVALFAAAVFSLALAGLAWVMTEISFNEALVATLPVTSAVLAPAILAVLLGPKVLEGVTVITETPAPEEADQFADRFRKLIEKARKSQQYPLVVFIDELDRCAPNEVVSTLRDLKTFLDEPDCAFIVAADRDVIVRALRQEVDQARPVREEEPYYATPGAYLDKIFQHQIALPPLRAKALTEFARTLADAQEDGVWAEMRDSDADVYDRVIFALVPVHVRSPRRVKVLLNNFATNARVAQARGLDWPERAHELAVLTVLQTEFPSVIHDLRRVPRLLTYLRGEETPAADEAVRVTSQHTVDDLRVPPPPPSQDQETPSQNDDRAAETSDDLIADLASPAEERRGATNTLRQQLHNYLRKLSAAGLPDPRPDLLYLRPAASRELLPDPVLSDAIDFATDTDPAQVVEIFAEQSSSNLAIAVPLLVSEGEQAQGLGRQFAYEAACMLVERLDPSDHRLVSVQIAPAIITSLRDDELSEGSLPGAVLMASIAGHRAAKDRLESIQGLPSETLSRLAWVAPFLTSGEQGLVADACASNLLEDLRPFLSLLQALPVEHATVVWDARSEQIVAALNESEMPTAPSPDVSATRNAPRRSNAPTELEPTGEGVALMEQIVGMAAKRRDGEPLLSAVYASFQTHPACSPFVQWTRRNAERYVAPMNSSGFRALHALLGIEAFQRSAWTMWAKYLSAPGEPVDQRIQGLATEVLLKELLPAFAQDHESPSGPELADLVVLVAAWAKIDASQCAIGIESLVQQIPWGGDGDPWAPRLNLYSVVHDIVDHDAGNGPLSEVITADLITALATMKVDEPLVDHFIQIVVKLPASLQEHLADHVEEEYEPAESDATARLLLRLEMRRLIGGNVISADELMAVEDPSTRVVDAWLGLRPPVAEVAGILGLRSGTTDAMSNYAQGLAVDDRTDLWVAAEAASVSDGLRDVIGKFGVGSAAVEHCRKVIAAQTQQTERKAAVARLCAATPTEGSPHAVAALRRAAGDLAIDLLNQSGGDLRPAADVMVWAGGSSPRGDNDLRELFDQQTRAHGNVLTKNLVTALLQLNLLSRKQSWLDKIFDR